MAYVSGESSKLFQVLRPMDSQIPDLGDGKFAQVHDSDAIVTYSRILNLRVGEGELETH